MKKTTGTVKIEVQAPRTLMHDVLLAAIEAGYTHGIGYWATEDGNDVELKRNDGALYPVKLVFYFEDAHAIEKAGGKQSTIDERDIARAIGRALTVGDDGTYADKNAADSAAQILAGDLDGPSADVIVQLAVFNEVVYG